MVEGSDLCVRVSLCPASLTQEGGNPLWGLKFLKTKGMQESQGQKEPGTH